MKQHPTRCAIYLRVSLDRTGEQLAVQRQREDCRAIAEQRGWTIVREYVDNSVSASDKRKARPDYDKLCADYEAGQFDALVCWDLDRLTRQPRQLEDWIDAAEENGLLLVTANGEADLTTDGGRLFARIKASVARSEVERKGKRQQRAAQQRSEQGKPPKGARLTGYTTDGETIPDEAKIVQTLFERFAAGDSLRSLATWLDETGVPTRSGRAWNPSSVRGILTNSRYAGRAIYQGQETGKSGQWEALVSDDVFTVVNSRLADPRRRTQQGTDRKHLGAGLYLCGVCDKPVISWTGARYRCQNGCITRSSKNIDDYVIATIRERLAQPDLADLVAPPKTEEAQRVSADVARLRARLTRIGEDYDAGLIDGQRYSVASRKVREELTEAEAAQARLSTASGAVPTLRAADPVAAFDAASLMLRRTVIDALVTVRLYPAPRGRKTFDPMTVHIEPRSAIKDDSDASDQ